MSNYFLKKKRKHILMNSRFYNEHMQKFYKNHENYIKKPAQHQQRWGIEYSKEKDRHNKKKDGLMEYKICISPALMTIHTPHKNLMHGEWMRKRKKNIHIKSIYTQTHSAHT